VWFWFQLNDNDVIESGKIKRKIDDEAMPFCISAYI